MTKVVVSALLGVLALAGLLLGASWFAGVVVALAAATLVDLGGLLARAGVRPVLLAAAVPAVGLPVAIAVEPEAGWERLPAFVTVGFLTAVVLVLVFGRRRHVTAGLGATMVSALVVGLGAASLLLLAALPDGVRWVVGVGVVVAAADIGAAVSLRLLDRTGDADEPLAPREGGRWLPGLTPLLAVALAVVVVAVVLDPPLAPRTAAVLGLIGLVAAVGGTQVHRSLAVEAGVAVVDDRLRLGGGLVFSVVDAALLAAPAAYVLARSTAL